MIDAIKRRARWLLVPLLLCGLSAQAVLPVPDNGIVLRDSGELYYLRDESDQLTLDALRQGAGEWRRVDKTLRLPRASAKPVWLRAQLAASNRDQPLILFNPLPRQIVLDVFVVENNAVVARYETGTSRPFAMRPLPYRSFLFPIALHAQQPLDIYVRVLGYPSRTVESLQLWPEQKLLTELPVRDVFEWATIGVMFVATLAACLVWLFVRQRIFGLFALFVATQLIGYLVTRGYAVAWFWPNSPRFDVAAEPLVVSIALLVNVGFSVAFLKMREQTPRLYRVAKYALIALAPLAVAAPFWPVEVETIGVLCLLVMYLFLLGVSLYLFRHGRNRTDAGVFLLCSGIYLVITVLVLTTSLLGTYSWWYSIHLTDFGQLQRILLFAACLGYRFRETVRGEESARADARAKSEFLARMSHEIRTPMNGILGMSELLRDAGLNSIQRRYNDIVYASASSLLAIINDILDFSKIQAGQMTLEKVPLDLHRLAVDVLSLFRFKADEKNIELLLDIRPNVAAWVLGDPTRIRQILVNYLSNAIKFTEFGEIRLRLSKSGDYIRLAVIDSGTGISYDAQARLFKSFVQADASVARSYGGTGLGLAITLQLTELMGGRVGVQSQPGKGSTFWAELPLPATTKQEPVSPLVLLQDKSILIVDDNSHFCELVAEPIKSWGMYVEFVHSAEAALARVRDLNVKGTRFDLISIDLKMPGMNGLELARALRSEYSVALPPLLLLTAAADIPDSVELRSAGIVLAQEKPLLASDLREAFARALGLVALTTAAPVVPAAAELPDRALIVLVVEDNPTNQIVIQSMLQKLGHACLLAPAGADGIAIYTKRHNEIDLILMDCDMPDIDGYEATRRIRAYEREQCLTPKHIVALTAHTLEEYITRCLDAGMNDHLAKPVGIVRLREFLDECSRSTAN